MQEVPTEGAAPAQDESGRAVTASREFLNSELEAIKEALTVEEAMAWLKRCHVAGAAEASKMYSTLPARPTNGICPCTFREGIV